MWEQTSGTDSATWRKAGLSWAPFTCCLPGKNLALSNSGITKVPVWNSRKGFLLLSQRAQEASRHLLKAATFRTHASCWLKQKRAWPFIPADTDVNSHRGLCSLTKKPLPAACGGKSEW